MIIMRKAKLDEIKKINIVNEDFSKDIKENDVIVKVKYCGLCGTDLHIFNHGREDVILPRVMGHELSGEVTEIGKKVSNVSVGDRVALNPVVSCGECSICKSGHENVCPDVKCFGVHMDGAFQDYIKVNAKRLYNIPDEMSLQEAALIEPYSIAANIIERARIQKGELVVIFGSGPIGLVLIQALKGLGSKVIVTDIIDSRLEKAKEFGADKTINTSKEDLNESIKAFNPNGENVIIDAVGNSKLLALAVEIAKPTTRIVNLGFDANSSDIRSIDITKKELEIIGSRMNCNTFPTVIDWYNKGIIQPKKMISTVYDFNDIQKAFDDVLANPKEYIKVLLKY